VCNVAAASEVMHAHHNNIVILCIFASLVTTA